MWTLVIRVAVCRLKRSTGRPTRMWFSVSELQERVKQLGGHMKVESNNNGTTIQAILPWERMTVAGICRCLEVKAGCKA